MCNKEARAEASADALSEILSSGCAQPRLLPSMLGRLQIAQLRILGHLGLLALHDLRGLERSKSSSVQLGPAEASRGF